MSYPWWHIQGTFQDGTTRQFNATGMTSRHALEALLDVGTRAHQEHLFEEPEREHGDLVKLEVLHISTPGFDEAAEQCPDCTRT